MESQQQLSRALSYHLVLLSALLFPSAAAQAPCYFPGGTIAKNAHPCNTSAAVSVCCGPNAVCLSNGLCLQNGSNYWRGACTDQTWLSQECPGWCKREFSEVSAGSAPSLTAHPEVKDSGANIISCQNVTHDAADYACESPANGCDSGIYRFRIDPDYVTEAVYISSAGSFSLEPQSSTSTALSTSAASSGVVALTTSSTQTSATATSTPLSPPGLTTGAKAGIGVGAAVGILLIVALGTVACVFYRRAKPRHDTITASPNMEKKPPAYGQRGAGLASDRVVPEMEGQQLAELEDGMSSELQAGQTVETGLPKERNTKSDVHEMGT